MCGIDGCREVFTAFAAFNSHIYRHHRAAVGVARNEEDMGGTDNVEAVGTYDSVLLDVDSGDEDVYSCATAAARSDYPSETDTQPQAKKLDKDTTAAKFLLGLREGHQVSQAAVADVICGCKELCHLATETIKERVQQCLIRGRINYEHIPGLLEVFEADSNPFQAVATKYLLERFQLGCLVSAYFCQVSKYRQWMIA